MQSFPDHWEAVSLKDVVSYRKGKKPKVLSNIKTEGTVPYVDIKAFSTGNIRRYADIKSSNLTSKENVLVVWDGARSGLVGIGQGGAIGSTIMALRPIEIDSMYLFRFLQTQYETINSNPRGTGIPHVDPGLFWNIKTPIAPINEQRRIVAKLEKLLQKVDACKERLDKIPTILKRFRQSILATACSGRLTAYWREEHIDVEPANELIERIIVKRKTRYEAECADATREGKRKPARPQRPKSLKPDYFEAPDSWDLALSYDLFSLVTSRSRGWAKYYAENGPIFLRVGNLDHDSIKLDLSSIQRVNPPKGMEGTRTKIHVGDILISITADTGMIALIKEDIGEAYINQHIALARSLGGFPKEYLAWVLASEIGQKQFKELQRGMTKAGLGLDDIRSVRIPFPPLEEQHEIVRCVEALFKIADQIEERYKKGRTYVDKLTQSILAKAFRGELVPQDLNDEPASELLKRIQEEKDRQTKTREKRVKK